MKRPEFLKVFDVLPLKQNPCMENGSGRYNYDEAAFSPVTYRFFLEPHFKDQLCVWNLLFA
jgi:hypothetical protein